MWKFNLPSKVVNVDHLLCVPLSQKHKTRISTYISDIRNPVFSRNLFLLLSVGGGSIAVHLNGIVRRNRYGGKDAFISLQVPEYIYKYISFAYYIGTNLLAFEGHEGINHGYSSKTIISQKHKTLDHKSTRPLITKAHYLDHKSTRPEFPRLAKYKICREYNLLLLL
jgi:hypothetical protein